jgi:predicted hydrolase (HD superfamily)
VTVRLTCVQCRPETDVRSVVKKMKDKGFARLVPRDQLEKDAVELGL